MVESYLGVEIPSSIQPKTRWEDVYKTVILLNNRRHLFYTRDLFYAQLGALLVAPFDTKKRNMLEDTIKLASLEAIAFMLTLPELEKEWENPRYVRIAADNYRDDVALLLLQDGRCTNNTEHIPDITVSLFQNGCEKAFIYIADKFPNDMPGDMPDMPDELTMYYPLAVCYRIDNAILKVEEMGQEISDEDIRTGKEIVAFIDTGMNARRLAYKIGQNGIHALIKRGYLRGGHELVKYSVEMSAYKGLYQTICISLLRNPDIKFSQLKPYLDNAVFSVKVLLKHMIPDSHHNITIVKQLSALVSSKDRDEFIKEALEYGNWEYAKIMRNV
jgi:hypothetical protein